MNPTKTEGGLGLRENLFICELGRERADTGVRRVTRPK